MSLRGERVLQATHGFPRVSGDEPGEVGAALDHLGFSPRERG